MAKKYHGIKMKEQNERGRKKARVPILSENSGNRKCVLTQNTHWYVGNTGLVVLYIDNDI